MSPSPIGSTRGFTLVELLIVVVVASLGLYAALSVFGSADRLVQRSHAHVRAAARHREGQAALSHLLRTAEGTTLNGFDAKTGITSRLTFDRLIGMADGKLIRTGETVLEWRPLNEDVDDVDEPGAVYVVDAEGTRVLARNVPEGGFHVRREGRSLVVRLTTYYVSSTRQQAWVTTDTAVSIRN